MEPIHPVDIPMHQSILIVALSVLMGTAWFVVATGAFNFPESMVKHFHTLQDMFGWLVHWLNWL